MTEIINFSSARKGSMGDVTVYQSNGKTYMRSRYNSTTHHTLSKEQLRQCTRMYNLVRLWQAFPHGERPVFQCRREGSTSYNMFITYAMQAHHVYMTKRMQKEHACIVTDVMVAQGSLPEIWVGRDDVGPITDIALGGLTIGGHTTVREVALAVVRNNYDYQFGDRLRFYLCEQWYPMPYDIPMVKIRCDELTLDEHDHRALREVMFDTVGFADRGGRLAASHEVVGGMAWVHLRHRDNEVQLSTQRLFCNNDTLMQQYGSEEAFAKACESYRGR